MKTINLSEEAYNKLVNEISYGKVQDASDESEHIFYDMSIAFQDFYDTVKYNPRTTNPYVQKIKFYADAINDILTKKVSQQTNFNKELGKFDYNKFYENGEEEPDYDGLDLKYLQQNYPKGN